MVKIKLDNFGGMVPIIDDTLLPDSGASYSENAWMYSGALLGLRRSRLITALDPTTRRTYRIPLSEDQPYNYSNSFYMEFTDPQTKVVRSPVFNDSFERYYWASPTQDWPAYNTRARILNGDPAFRLGVPAPSTAPAIGSVTGGALADETRVYVTTWVSLYGEESAPSAPVTFTGKPDGTWNLTMTAPTAGEEADRNLDKVRIYRIVTGSTGIPVYFLVTELDIATTSYGDALSDATISANEVLSSFNYEEPPADLQGIVQMANGVFAGWRDNEVWFSEPFRPHAWPSEFVLTVEFPIVNCGVYGQTLIVATTGNPYTITGTAPENMTPSKFMAFEPIISPHSMVASEAGVFYVSHNGLINVVPGQMQNVTREIIDRRKWVVDFNAQYLHGARLNSAYFAFGSVESGCFEPTAFEVTAFEQDDFTGSRDGFYLDLQNPRVGVNKLVEDEPVLSAHEDAWSGDIMVVGLDNNLYVLDPSDEQDQRYYTWRSKAFHMAKPLNLGAVKVRFAPTEPAMNTLVRFDGDGNPGLEAYGWVRVFADGIEIFERELTQSGKIDRLPSGFKAEYWSVEVEARVRVLSIELGSTPRELIDV